MKSFMGPSGTAFQYDENLEGEIIVTPMGHPECRFPAADALALMTAWMVEVESMPDQQARDAFLAAAKRAGER